MSRFVDVCRFALSNIGTFPKFPTRHREFSQKYINAICKVMKTTLDNLKEYLKKEGISVVQLSKKTGIPQDRMYSWLRGKGKPKAEDQLKLERLWDIGKSPVEPDTETPAPTQRGGVVPDPQIPGIYQDIVMELIESSKAQREISKALLEERHLIRETAQAAISLAAHTVESAKEQPSWNMIENRTDVIERSLRDLEKAVVYGFAESLHKKPEEIEVLLHSGWNPGRQSGKKKIAGN